MVGRTKIVACLAVCLMFAGLTATAVLARALVNYTGTLYATDSHSAATYSWSTNTNRLTGTLYDLSSGDERCARVYDRGYNYFLGWGDWKLLKTVCAGGRTGYSDFIGVYADKVKLQVCAGFSACRQRQIYG
jgi:hypothetical protein